MNNKKIYELVQPAPKQLEIKSYTIRYANCDYLHADDILSSTRRIFERKKLDVFKELNQYDYLENELVFGFTQNEEMAKIQLKKIQLLYEIQRLENKLCDLDMSRSYYDKKIKENLSQLEYLNVKANTYKPLAKVKNPFE